MLRSIILQQKEERDILLNRSYQKRISVQEITDYLASGLIKLITGPRRAGKSVFALQMLTGHNFAYLNFDDDLVLKNFDENLIWQYLSEIYPDFAFMMLDEIQNLPGWDLWVSKLYRRGVNLVFVELIRRGYSTPNNLFYYHTRNGKEVDFVFRDLQQVSGLIRVSCDVSAPKTLKREVSALTEAASELQCRNLLLLTWDQEYMIEEKDHTIRVIPLWKWLLNEKATA